MHNWVCMCKNRVSLLFAHLLEQTKSKLKQAAARNVVNAMDFFLPIINSRINIHMVPGGKGINIV